MAQKTKSGGAGTAMLAMPEGFSTTPSKHFAQSVARRFDTLLPTAGVVRILLVLGKGTNEADVRALISNPRMRLKRKAPGLFEATVLSKDMDALIVPNTGDGKMFRWVDLAHRCYGAPVTSDGQPVRVAIAYGGAAAEAKKKLGALGMTLEDRKAPEGAEDWVDPDAGLYTGTIAGGKIADLVMSKAILSIEVRPEPMAETEGGAEGE